MYFMEFYIDFQGIINSPLVGLSHKLKFETELEKVLVIGGAEYVHNCLSY